MKFLIALSILASSTVFANEGGEWIKCWNTSQEEGGKPSYVFKVVNSDIVEPIGKTIYLKYPELTEAPLIQKDGCLFAYGGTSSASSLTGPSGAGGGDGQPEYSFEACSTQGQEINGLIPVDIGIRTFNEEETVYCERSLKKWFEEDYGGGGNNGPAGMNGI